MKKDKTNQLIDTNFKLVGNSNSDLPNLVLTIPKGIDTSKWCAEIKRAHGNNYNIIFKIPITNLKKGD